MPHEIDGDAVMGSTNRLEFRPLLPKGELSELSTDHTKGLLDRADRRGEPPNLVEDLLSRIFQPVREFRGSPVMSVRMIEVYAELLVMCDRLLGEVGVVRVRVRYRQVLGDGERHGVEMVSYAITWV